MKNRNKVFAEIGIEIAVDAFACCAGYCKIFGFFAERGASRDVRWLNQVSVFVGGVVD